MKSTDLAEPKVTKLARQEDGVMIEKNLIGCLK